MPDWLALFARPIEESHVDLPNAEIVFNHRTRTVFMCVDIPKESDASEYDDLAAHFAKRGYFLQILALPVVIPSQATSVPQPPKKT